MQKSNYEVEVLVNGKPLREYLSNGKLYVEGREGTIFSLRIRNNSSQRKLFIPSIDGLSVMNGKNASYESSGYIVRPHSSLTIDGWRTSDSEVASFYFSSPKESYRQRTGQGNNLGVIGVVVFAEKERVPVVFLSASSGGILRGMGMSNTAGINTSAFAMNVSSDAKSFASQQLGTGWGEAKRSEVITVEFDRESHPDAVFEIYYNTREELTRLGVDLRKEPVYVAPQAFPGQYCSPPKDGIYYGPHPCEGCGHDIARKSHAEGGDKYDYPKGPIYPNTPWIRHECQRMGCGNTDPSVRCRGLYCSTCKAK